MESTSLRQAFTDHPRQWQSLTLVYPVIARRSHGMSIGINLNPDTICNFNCIYCCVNRQSDELQRQPDRTYSYLRPTATLDVLTRELDRILELVYTGTIWRHPPFRDVPDDYRRVNDIAFSGDGEPTASPLFPAAVDLVKALKHRHELDDAKIVVITNATMLDRPDVEAAIKRLDKPSANGEIWAKLDAGTEADYQRINRTAVPFAKVLDNIARCGRERNIKIQTMLLAEHDQPPSEAFVHAYGDRLEELLKRGCQIKAIQLYTIARQTAVAELSPLTAEQLDDCAALLQQRFADLEIKTFA